MRLLPWILLLFAALALFGLWQLVGKGSPRAPLDLLDRAEARVRAPEPDHRAALREFDLAVRLAEERGDPLELAEVVRRRARYLQSRQALREAQNDLERALELGAEPRAEVHLELATLLMLAGDWARSIEQAQRTLELSPTHGGAHAIRGRVHAARAEAELEAVQTRVRTALASADATRVLAWVDRAATLEPTDPARATLLLEIDRSLPRARSADAEAVRSGVESASRLFALARQAFGASLEAGMRADVVLSLLDLDLRSERPLDAVDLGLAARLHPQVEEDSRTLQLLALGLDRVGRRRAASIVLEQAVKSGRYLEARFLPQWCVILFQAQEWNALFNVATDLVGRTPDVEALRRERAAGDFFLGAAAHQLGRKALAQTSLARFTSRPAPEPVPGAFGMAWIWIAEMERERGDLNAERLALDAAVRANPEVSGEAWLRLSELSDMAGLSPAGPLHQRTHALRLLPERIEELLPAWRELGRRVLLDQARDVERVYPEVVASGRFTPPGNPSVFELWRYAELHSDRQRWFGVAAACRQILQQYPRFLPALDLLAEAHRENGKQAERADLLLERLEHIPGSEIALLELRELHDRGGLLARQVLALMRLDPRHTGVLAVAKDLLDSKQPDVAARGLVQAGIDSLGDPGRVLLAACELELGRPAEVRSLLAPVAAESPKFSQALALSIRAAWQQRDLEALDAEVLRARETAELHKPTLVAVVDELLAKGEWHPAWTLLHELDSRVVTRGGDVTVRVAVAALVAKETAAAREALQRARAQRTDGAAEMGEVVLSAQTGQWSRLPALVQSLRRSQFQPAPLGDVLMLALEERVPEALALAADNLESVRTDSRWPLAQLVLAALSGNEPRPPSNHGREAAAETRQYLFGSEAQRRDPRLALVHLLATEWPEWCVWLLAELAGASASDGGLLWPNFLSTLAEQNLAHRVAFRSLLLQLTGRFPDFAPGWTLLERAEEERLERLDHPDLLILGARRKAALGGERGEGQGTNVETLLALSVQAAMRGDVQRARELARQAVEAAPDNLAARLTLAGWEARAGDPVSALVHYAAFFQGASPAVAFDRVPDLLELLERAMDQGSLPPGAAREALLPLAQKLPSDPAVALALAGLELRLAAETPVLAMERAWAILEAFRERTAPTPLEYLRVGSTALWTRFYLRQDIQRAEQLVELELERQPASVELWILEGQVLEAKGERDAAMAHYETLRAMAPDPRVILRMAVLHGESGVDLGRVERELERVRLMEGRGESDPELRFLRASAFVQSGPSLLNQGIDLLAGLWTDRKTAAAPITVARLGRRYGAALLHRGWSDDRERAQAVLLEAAQDASDGSERRFLERLARVAAHMPKDRAGRAQDP